MIRSFATSLVLLGGLESPGEHNFVESQPMYRLSWLAAEQTSSHASRSSAALLTAAHNDSNADSRNTISVEQRWSGEGTASKRLGTMVAKVSSLMVQQALAHRYCSCLHQQADHRCSGVAAKSSYIYSLLYDLTSQSQSYALPRV
jgi:hypothetical protein